MADELPPTISDLPIDPDVLKDYLELLERVASAQGNIEEKLKQISLYDQQRLADASEALRNLQDQQAMFDDIQSANERIQEIKDEATQTGQASSALDMAERRFLEEKVDRLSDITTMLNSQQNLNNARALANNEELQNRIKLVTVLKVREEIEKKLMQMPSRGAEGDKKRFNLSKDLMKAMQGTALAFEDIAKNTADLGIETAAMSLLVPGLGVDKLMKDYQGLPLAVDESYRNIIKSGFSHTPKMQQSYITMMDPINAAAKEFGYIAEDSIDMFISNVGILGPEAEKATLAARNNISLFRRAWAEASKENFTQMAATENLIAVLGKLGVAEEDTAKNIDFFNKALNESPTQARESVRQLTNVAHTLDINVATMFKDFGAVVGDLSQYGGRTTEVFADLQAQATATGMQVGSLAKVAGKLDTFKGAAQMAQGFNAVMGKTVLSVTDLVHAEPAEKINLLREAMERSGMSFETANRRVKSIVANLMGVDVAEASRIFGTKEDFFELKKGMDTGAEGLDDLAERARNTMTVADRAAATQSSLVAGSQALIAEAHKSADKMTNLMLSNFKDIRKQTDNSREAVIGFLGMLTVAGERVSTAKRLGRSLIGAAAGAQMVQMVMEKTGMSLTPAIYKVEDFIGQDIGGPNGIGIQDGWIGEPGAPGSRQVRASPPPGAPVRELAAAPTAAPGEAGTGVRPIIINFQSPLQLQYAGGGLVTVGEFNKRLKIKQDAALGLALDVEELA